MPPKQDQEKILYNIGISLLLEREYEKMDSMHQEACDAINDLTEEIYSVTNQGLLVPERADIPGIRTRWAYIDLDANLEKLLALSTTQQLEIKTKNEVSLPIIFARGKPDYLRRDYQKNWYLLEVRKKYLGKGIRSRA